MSEAYQIISEVHGKFKRVVQNLARLTGKSTEWFNSHGREPKTLNPLQTGNLSPVAHYLQYCRQNEAAEKGAGRMINSRVHAELDMEFAEGDLVDCSQKEYHAGVLKESFDVLDCLNKYDFENDDRLILAMAEEEAAQLRDKASELVSHIRAVKRMKEANNGTRKLAAEKVAARTK